MQLLCATKKCFKPVVFSAHATVEQSIDGVSLMKKKFCWDCAMKISQEIEWDQAVIQMNDGDSVVMTRNKDDES